MCGIAGILSRRTLGSGDLDRLARMSDAMTHRGPDGHGVFQSPHFAMAVRRLSIIDPETGWQPLYNEDHSLALVANGEIYNYIEIREQLRQRGHRFRTGSDCEVIVHLYEQFGDACVDHLRGMFAFALWDAHKQRLLLARDRMGEKPLYFAERDGQLVFGSELKTLVASGLMPFALDARAIDAYFHYQYVPEPLTPIQDIRKLPAANLLAVTLDNWSVTQKCYWRMEDASPIDGDPATLIRTELESISELVIRSDVPVGIALSGGLDSSAIAVLAVKRYAGSMHAFSVGYEDRPRSDERAPAQELAEHLDMPFHEVEITTGEMVEAFPKLLLWSDDPIADISGYGYYVVARAAREQGVPVLLQGQGGDELFWGYGWVTEAARQSVRKARLNSGGPAMKDYLRLSWPKIWPRRAPINWLISLAGLRTSWDALQRDRRSPRERLVFYDLSPDFRTASESITNVYHPRIRESLGDSSPFDLFTLPLPWPQLEILLTRLICETYLLENGIVQGDRLSMASSVELRLPLVDYRLVETVIGLRKTRSDLDLAPKTWFRDAMKDLVPSWVLKRRKRGFQPPILAWHRALFARYGHLLTDGALVHHGILKPEAARQLGTGGFPWGATAPLSFKALVLEVWCRQISELPQRSQPGEAARGLVEHHRGRPVEAAHAEKGFDGHT
jgi:asparagine synthase (glutamine-hydrolysing)